MRSAARDAQPAVTAVRYLRDDNRERHEEQAERDQPVRLPQATQRRHGPTRTGEHPENEIDDVHDYTPGGSFGTAHTARPATTRSTMTLTHSPLVTEPPAGESVIDAI